MEVIWLIAGIGAGSFGMWSFLNWGTIFPGGNGTFSWPNAAGQTPTSSTQSTPDGPPDPNAGGSSSVGSQDVPETDGQ